MKKRAKSVYQSKSLGTIKDRKKKKQESNKEGSNGETILRILRMRCAQVPTTLSPADIFTSQTWDF